MRKNLDEGGIQTWGCWVVSKNASTELCSHNNILQKNASLNICCRQLTYKLHHMFLLVILVLRKEENCSVPSETRTRVTGIWSPTLDHLSWNRCLRDEWTLVGREKVVDCCFCFPPGGGNCLISDQQHTFLCSATNQQKICFAFGANFLAFSTKLNQKLVMSWKARLMKMLQL